MKKPFSDKLVIRVLLLTVICLALLAGYYHALLGQINKQLEVKQTPTSINATNRDIV